jgi:predicted component of type VI protein secretion system
MKKTMILTVAASFFLMFIVSAAHAQGWVDLSQEGTHVVAASKFMMAQAQKIKTAKDMDRAMLVDEGLLLIKYGSDYEESGEMMYTDDGRANMQEIGMKLRQIGGGLLKMGRQKGTVTQKEKEEIAKQADTMAGLGKLMLAKGQDMGGN